MPSKSQTFPYSREEVRPVKTFADLLITLGKIGILLFLLFVFVVIAWVLVAALV